MSDAQGEKKDATTGDPIEERTDAAAAPAVAPVPADERPSALADALGEDPDVPPSVTPTRDADADAAQAEASSQGAGSSVDAGAEVAAAGGVGAAAGSSAETDRTAETAAESDRPAETTAGPASERVAEPAPATRASAPATREPAPAEAPEEPARASEPDYAALAAELDELEARHAAGAAAVTPAPAPADAAPEAEAASAEPARSPWFERADETQTFRATEPEPPAVTASEPVVPAAPAQPVFVEAPEPPRKRGNRAAAGAIGLLAAVAFAVLYFAVIVGLRALEGEASFDNLAEVSLELVTSVAFWIPVVVFFLAFWLLGVIVNRASWVAWVLLGLFVGLAAYAGHVFAPVLAGPFWLVTPTEAATLVQENLLTPVSVAAFVIGREVTVWFGGWVAKRGARMTRLNAEAQEEYDKTLEAGPAA